jgi:hypothetical protein
MTGWKARAICAAGLLWCGIVLLLHMLAGNLACWGDTSTCAVGPDRRVVYQGVLTDELGRPRADTPFTVAFGSRENQPRVGGLRTDANGGYCVFWAFERATPVVYVGSRVEGTDGTSVPMGILDKPGAPPPAGCAQPQADIPWKRADGVTDTWQYRSLQVVAITAALLLTLGLVRGRGWRPGIALAAAASALWAVLWLT